MGVVITLCLVCLGTGTDGSTGRKCSRCKGSGRDPGLYELAA